MRLDNVITAIPFVGFSQKLQLTFALQLQHVQPE